MHIYIHINIGIHIYYVKWNLHNKFHFNLSKYLACSKAAFWKLSFQAGNTISSLENLKYLKIFGI